VLVHSVTPSIDVPNNTVVTATFNSESFDTNGYHSTVTNTSRLTVPTGKAGYYYIFAKLEYAAGTPDGNAALIFLNEGAIAAGVAGSGGTDFGVTVPVYTIAYLAVGDYIELKARQITGGSRQMKMNNANETNLGMFLIGV
jgi:hypothetical protein